MRVVADCREPADLIAALRAAAAAGGSSVDVEVEALDAGDFLIGPSAAVERKTGADFVASILDGRFAEQAAKLRATYEKVFWLVEGDPYQGGSEHGVALEPKMIAGALSHLAVVEGATLLHTDGAEQSAALILSMAKRFQDGRRDLQLRPLKPQDPRLLAEFILCGLPRIGRGKARLLLERFGSVRAVVNATEAEIAAVKGFGRKTAAAIRAALDAPYDRAAGYSAGIASCGADDRRPER
jgi:Fanconi anemia group M protein